MRDALTLYHAQAKQRIEEHGGTLEKFAGDAVMAVFGAPVAYGDDAVRAVRGLAVLGRGVQNAPLSAGRRQCWEQGVISPPVDSLMEIIHACGFDLPFTLMPIDKSADQELREALLAPPSERVEWLLKELGLHRARAGR